ncbi:hypothetical protein BV20DRAFT_971202 [Pilatotrama ljubarskyi]|nr:hypothetical protein BV20DRAFT_971202 [Pilatotrama ljubarskyi]
MKFSLLTILAASLTLVASRAVSNIYVRTDPDPTHGQIIEPTPGAHIAPGALFNFSYRASADYCRVGEISDASRGR